VSEPNLFGDLLALIGDEELIRIRHRAKKRGALRMAEILTDEIHEREQIEQQELELERARRAAAEGKPPV
jgi:hypothetical protein